MNRTLRQRCLILLLPVVLAACNKPLTADALLDQAVKAITPADTIQTIVTEAACEGPKGSYTTTVHSDRAGYTYFKQVYAYANNSTFEAIVAEGVAYQLVNDSISTALDEQTAAALRSHEFHMILIDAVKRFHDFREPQHRADQVVVHAEDALNNPVEIHFHTVAPEIHAITMRNPGDTTERIHVTYSNWQLTQGIRLPMQVTIQQGADKTFTFRFTHVAVNSNAVKRIKA